MTETFDIQKLKEFSMVVAEKKYKNLIFEESAPYCPIMNAEELYPTLNGFTTVFETYCFSFETNKKLYVWSVKESLSLFKDDNGTASESDLKGEYFYYDFRVLDKNSKDILVNVFSNHFRAKQSFDTLFCEVFRKEIIYELKKAYCRQMNETIDVAIGSLTI